MLLTLELVALMWLDVLVAGIAGLITVYLFALPARVTPATQS